MSVDCSLNQPRLCRTARRGLLFAHEFLQAEVERRGKRIFELVDRHPESIFSKAGFYQRMMALSMRDEHFKVQMFRFVDVLASLHRGSDIVQHLDEYFADMRNGFAPLVHTGVRAARRSRPGISGALLRWNVSGMARQFIAGRNPDDVMKTLRKRRKERIGFTVDLVRRSGRQRKGSGRIRGALSGTARRTRRANARLDRSARQRTRSFFRS